MNEGERRSSHGLCLREGGELLRLLPVGGKTKWREVLKPRF